MHLSFVAYPQITFAPLLYPLVSLFLHFHTPKDTYRSIAALVSTIVEYIVFVDIDQCLTSFFYLVAFLTRSSIYQY